MPLMPAPPMPTKWMRERSVNWLKHQRRSLRQLLEPVGDRGRGARAGQARGRRAPIARQALAVGEQRGEQRAPAAPAVTSPPAQHLGGAGRRRAARALSTWCPWAMASGSSSEARPAAQISARVMRAGARDEQVARGHGAGHVVEERHDLDLRRAGTPLAA